jgi:pentatricopeptide repeat protein
MEDLHESGHEQLKPNARTWNTVLNCFRHAGQRDFHRAFKVLDRFRAAVVAGKIDEGPNLITWNTLLAGCVENTKDDNRVQQIWDLMSDDNCKPDVITYNTIFSCFTRYAASREKAEKSMMRFVKRMHADVDIEPSKVTYLRLLEAWIALGRVDMAENVLSDLCNKASSGNDVFVVDREAFHRVILAWSGLKKVRRAESILLLMHNLHEKYGLEAVGPSLETYNIILQSWAKSGEKQSGERAEFLLRQMAVRGLHPSRVTYNIVLNAWAQSGDLVAYSKIESLVLEMILCGKQESCPDEATYNTWMNAILNEIDERTKTRRVNGLLATMKIHDFEPSDFIKKQLARIAGKDEQTVNAH